MVALPIGELQQPREQLGGRPAPEELPFGAALHNDLTSADRDDQPAADARPDRHSELWIMSCGLADLLGGDHALALHIDSFHAASRCHRCSLVARSRQRGQRSTASTPLRLVAPVTRLKRRTVPPSRSGSGAPRASPIAWRVNAAAIPAWWAPNPDGCLPEAGAGCVRWCCRRRLRKHW